MIKLLLVFCSLSFIPTRAIEIIKMDGIDYEMVPVMLDEHQTSSLEELYYCGACACEECLKERHGHDEEEKIG